MFASSNKIIHLVILIKCKSNKNLSEIVFFFLSESQQLLDISLVNTSHYRKDTFFYCLLILFKKHFFIYFFILKTFKKYI